MLKAADVLVVNYALHYNDHEMGHYEMEMRHMFKQVEEFAKTPGKARGPEHVPAPARRACQAAGTAPRTPRRSLLAYCHMFRTSHGGFSFIAPAGVRVQGNGGGAQTHLRR